MPSKLRLKPNFKMYFRIMSGYLPRLQTSMNQVKEKALSASEFGILVEEKTLLVLQQCIHLMKRKQ